MFRQGLPKLFNLFLLLEICKVSTSMKADRPDIIKYKIIRMPFIDSGLLEECPQASKAPYYLTLDMFGKKYILSLYQGKRVLAPDAKIIVRRGEHELEEVIINAKDLKNLLVDGEVIGHSGSRVSGYLDDGIFNGIVRVDEEYFFIESANKFINGSEKYDVIVYRGSDLEILPHFYRNNVNRSSDNSFKNCNMQNYSIDEESWEPIVEGDRSVPDFARPRARVCNINVVGDHWFARDLHHNDLNKAMTDVEFHIKEADKLFYKTDFDNNGSPDGISVRVASVKFFENPRDRAYTLGDPGLNAVDYLERFSYYDHNRFCGALAFSFKKFPDDVLGYAYRGGRNKIGGICYKRISYEGKMRSMNVGMVSFNAPWGLLSVWQRVIVVTHELGHMFGSPHDEDIDGGACFVPDKSRHYIMSSQANPGHSEINREFSICSRKMIYENLKINGKCLTGSTICSTTATYQYLYLCLVSILLWQKYMD